MSAAARPAPSPAAQGARVGALAGLALAVMETIAARSGGSPLAGPILPFVAQLLLVLVAVGALLGLVQGALVSWVDALCVRTRRGDGLRRLLFALLLTVPFSLLWLQLLADRWPALGTAARTRMVFGLVLLQPLILAGVGLVLRGYRHFVDPATRPAWRLALLGVPLGASLLCYRADATVLPGLYDPMHHALALGAFLSMELFVLGALTWARPHLPAPRAVRWAFVGVLLGVTGVRALARIGEDPALTFMALERTRIQSKLLKVARSLVDRDGDGYSPILGGGDCDDNDPLRHPGALDLPENGIDEDCSGADLRLEDLAPPAPAPPPLAETRPYPVLLITIDALRADHVGAYGYARPTTPSLDALAAEAWRFERAYAQSNNTAASIPSLVTGRYPSSSPWSYDHPKQRAPGWAYVTDEGNVTLAELLRDAGYRTGLFIDRPILLELGLGQGYTATADAADSAARLAAFAREPASGPWHAWLHLYHPHAPYSAHERFDFGQTDLDRYDGEIAAADAEVGALFDALRKAGKWDDTIVVVTADHGEEFRDHGGTQHATTLYEELVRVPLIVKLPGLGARTVRQPVELVDVLPTILQVIGRPGPAWLDGRSLLRELDATDGEATAYTEKYNGQVWMSALVKDDWKLIAHRRDRFFELYDLGADPREQRNLAGDEPGRLKRLRMELDTLAARRELVLLANARRHPEGRLQLARSLELVRRPELVREALSILEGAADDRYSEHLATLVQRDGLDDAVRARALALLERIGGVEALRGLIVLAASSEPSLAELAGAATKRLAPAAQNPFVWPERVRAAPEVEHVDFGTRHGHWRVLEGIGEREQVSVRSLAWSEGKRTRVALWVDPKRGTAPGDYVLDAVAEAHSDAPEEGLEVSVTLNDRVLGAVRFAGDFEPRTLRVPRDALRPGLNVLDLGYAVTFPEAGKEPAVHWDYLVLSPERPSGVDLLPGSPQTTLTWGDGWGPLELWQGVLHRLSRGRSSTLRLELAPGAEAYRFRYEAAGRTRPVAVTVEVNGRAIGSVDLAEAWTTGALSIPEGVLVDGPNTVRFQYAKGPASSGPQDLTVRWHAIQIAPGVEGS
jgi:arylsulfatase A-like enzyme